MAPLNRWLTDHRRYKLFGADRTSVRWPTILWSNWCQWADRELLISALHLSFDFLVGAAQNGHLSCSAELLADRPALSVFISPTRWTFPISQQSTSAVSNLVCQLKTHRTTKVNFFLTKTLVGSLSRGNTREKLIWFIVSFFFAPSAPLCVWKPVYLLFQRLIW